jgi:hypothetical protein
MVHALQPIRWVKASPMMNGGCPEEASQQFYAVCGGPGDRLFIRKPENKQISRESLDCLDQA